MKDLGDASFVLGIEILWDRSQGILRLSQKNYIEKILSRFFMKDYATGDTPVAKTDKCHLGQCLKTILENKEM